MSHPPNSPFTDEQLGDDDSIRLLELQPGQRDSPIVIRLSVYNLTSAPPYEALSYVWGDPKKTEAIEIKSPATDMGPNLQLHVTTSCVVALRRLRSVEASRTLWVDAICINQLNIPERNHQLTLMTRIYNTAFRVVIYLGEKGDDDDSDAVMDWVQDLHAPSNSGERPQRPGVGVRGRFLRRRWFTRVWVMQEVRVAKAAIVVCGEKQVDWAAFQELKHFVNNLRLNETLPYTAQALIPGGVKEEKWRPSYPARLLRLLEKTRDFGATDARDKLFAILPLLDWESRQHLDANPCAHSVDQDQSSFGVIRADYSRSTAETFTQLSQRLIDAIGLDVLQTVITPTRVSHLPSWATDWSSSDTHLYHGPRWLRWDNFVEMDKSKDHISSSNWRFSTYVCSDGLETTELHVLGGLAGTIFKLGELCDVYADIFPLEQWKSMCSPIHLEEQKEWLHLSPFLKALTRDSDDRLPHYFYVALERIQQFNAEQLSVEADLSATKDDRGHSRGATLIDEKGGKRRLRHLFRKLYPSLQRYAELLFISCHGRRLFVMDNGLLGLAPKAAELGDQVVGMKGAATPFVVRPIEGHSEVFQLVGSCPSRGLLESVSKYEDIIIR